MSKRLLNTPETVVVDSLSGLVSCHSHLRRLDGFPDVKVIYDGNHDKSQVAIISGGGSGHEPAHAGYVGKGMLTAAVCGDVFASPSAEAVLAAIRTVTGPAGCLLVVKNYTGDRLHFGLAAEQAKAEGLAVEMVVVGEDVAIDTPGLAGRRGLAGTVFVHKVAGAAAVAGCSLQQVLAAAQQAAASMATLGVALTVCTLPGKSPSDRLGPGDIEIGLGIHGEPGHSKTAWLPAKPLVQLMLKQITSSSFFQVQQGDHVVLMVNNLGATPPMELYVAAHDALQHLGADLQLTVDRVYVGPFMTSLDMAGMSLTLLRTDALQGLDRDLLSLLDAPTAAPAWSATSAVPALDVPATPVPAGSAHEEQPSRPAELTATGQLLESCIAAAAQALVASASMLDELDSKVGDGDCGATLKQGAQAILSGLASHYPLNDPTATVMQIARSIRHSIGGTSGALYDIFATALAAKLKESGGSTTQHWSDAFAAGTAAVQKYGGASAGCRTMLDALLPAGQALQEAAAQGKPAAEAAAAAAAAAAQGAAATCGMAATAGRASYVPVEVLGSTPDPGAQAVAIWMKAVAEQLKAVEQAAA